MKFYSLWANLVQTKILIMKNVQTFRNLPIHDRVQLKFAQDLASDIILDISQSIRDYKLRNDGKSSFKYSPVSEIVIEQYKEKIRKESIANNHAVFTLNNFRHPDGILTLPVSQFRKKSYLSTLDFKKKYEFAQKVFSKEHIMEAYAGMLDLEWATPQPKPDPYKFLKLHLKEVYCRDETGKGLGEIGKDEINFGGVAIDEIGHHNEIKEFKVKSFSDNDGAAKRTKTYSGLGKVVHTYPLIVRNQTDYPMPYIYHSYITIAEKDCGGFAKFLGDLWKALKPIVIAAMMEIGASIGASIGSLGGPVGTVIGAVLGAVIGLLVGFIINAFKDDIFDPQIIAASLPSYTDNFNGSNITPLETFTYKQHNGKYLLKLRWSLEK